MDKREMLDRLAANGDERLLLGRVWDKYEQCRRRNLPEGTGFLSPAEQAAAQRGNTRISPRVSRVTPRAMRLPRRSRWVRASSS